MLTDQERRLILYLQKHPLASFAEISVGINKTPPTVKRWIDKLRSGEDRTIINISGMLESQSLGLEMHTYTIELGGRGVAQKLEVFKKLGDYHPYTSFQNRIFGAQNGILMQFVLPKGAAVIMDKLLDELSEDVNVKRMNHLPPSSISLESYPELGKFDNGYWNFNFSEWISTEVEVVPYYKMPLIKNVKNRLGSMDLILVRELMVNSRRKQVEIIKDILANDLYIDEEKKLFVNQQRKVSRRLEFINKNHIIKSHRLLYNRSKFQIFNQLVFTGKMSDKELRNVISLYKNHPPPFRSSFNYFSGENRYFWWLNLPPDQSSDAMNMILSISREMQMSIFDTNPDNLIFYPIWHRNFNKNEKSWIQDEEYMINEVLQNIK